MPWKMVLFIAALVCFILAALGSSPRQVNLIATGLAFWVATLVFF